MGVEKVHLVYFTPESHSSNLRRLKKIFPSF